MDLRGNKGYTHSLPERHPPAVFVLSHDVCHSWICAFNDDDTANLMPNRLSSAANRNQQKEDDNQRLFAGMGRT